MKLTCRCPGCKRSYPFRSDKYRYLYFTSSRCCSSTLKRYLPDIPHVEAYEPNPGKYLHYFSFGVVRNPWDRMVSIWSLFSSSTYGYRPHASKVLGKDTRGMSFPEFVRLSVKGINHHWEPMSNYFPEKLDYVVRFENFLDDMKVVQDKIGYHKPITLKVYPTKHDRYTTYYDDELVEIVRKVYSEDIERFAYTYGD